MALDVLAHSILNLEHIIEQNNSKKLDNNEVEDTEVIHMDSHNEDEPQQTDQCHSRFVDMNSEDCWALINDQRNVYTSKKTGTDIKMFRV